MVKIKHNDFMDAVPIMPCQNSLWLEDLWRRKNPDSSEFTCYNKSFGKDPG